MSCRGIDHSLRERVNYVELNYFKIYNLTFPFLFKSLVQISNINNYVLVVPPAILPFSFGEVPSSPGDVVQVTCLVSKGDTPFNITWKMDGHSAMSNDVTITKLGERGSLLMFSSVAAHHRGLYTCQVSNVAGETSYKATLVVNGMFFESCFYLLCR